MIDFKHISSVALGHIDSLVQQWLPGGSVKGREYVVSNPTRSDKHPSLSINLNSGIWKDFSNGDGGGDLISLLAYAKSIDQGEAAKQIAEYLRIDTGDSKPQPKPKSDKLVPFKKSPWTPIFPVPASAPPPQSKYVQTVDGIPTEWPVAVQYRYVNDAGETIGYASRIVKSPTNKIVLYQLYHENSVTKKQMWIFKHFPKPQPLYNLDLFKKYPDATIVIVEGEKCAQALQAIFDLNSVTDYIVTTWPGGCNNGKSGDYTHLHNRNVVFWPDNDRKLYKKNHPLCGQEMPKKEQHGWLVMMEIADIVKANVKSMKVIDVPGKLKPDTWDVADAINDDKWDLAEILRHIKVHTIDIETTEAATTKRKNLDESMFRCLGYNQDVHYYLPNGTKQLKALKSESHTSGALISLAPIWYWRSLYPSEKGGADWQAAASDLLRLSESKKVFNADMCRGRGAWIDENRIVVHLGDRLLVDNQQTEITDHKSNWIYEAGAPIKDNLDNPLNLDQAYKVLELVNGFHWKIPATALLAAGSAVLGPVCGALNWRPHIYITGGAGTGKTTFLIKFLRPLTGPFKLFAFGDSSAVGITQSLKSDSLYVMVDESEAENQADLAKFQSLIKLARISSSETEAKLYKGQTSHKAIQFEPRSMFCFSSIGVNIDKAADTRRIAICELTEPKMTKDLAITHFAALSKMLSDTFTPEYCASLRARTIKLLPIILKNCELFRIVVREILGDQPKGDQYGTLLAGAYSLQSDTEATYEQAYEFCKIACPANIVEQEPSDEIRLLNYILQFTIKIDNTELSVDEMIQEIMKRPDTMAINGAGFDDKQQKYYDILKRWGIRVDRDKYDKLKSSYIWISDSHTAIARILEKTPWPKTWARVLKRLPDAITNPAMRFIGSPTRATGIPAAIITGEAQCQ